MISDKGIRLPWSGADIPHAALDVLRGCNVKCEGCYNARPAEVKPIDQLRAEVDELMRLRRLQTLTLTGGEPALHPELPAIVRYIKSRKLRLAMLSNGLRLDEDLVGRLAADGMDMILLHIQSRQERPDLPPHPTAEQLRDLRAAKARLIHRHGMETGITGICYPGGQAEVRGLLDEVMSSPDLSFLLLCRRCNMDKFQAIRGHIGTRMAARRQGPESLTRLASVEMPEEPFNAVLADYGLIPFAYIGSSRDPAHPMWISFFVATLADASGTVERFCVRPSRLDLSLMKLMRRLHGRYVFFFKSSAATFRARLVLSALSNRRNAGLWRLLLRSFRPGAVLREKHVVIEHSPELMPDGEVVYCRECPDATLRNGVLMPPCLADRVEPAPAVSPPS